MKRTLELNLGAMILLTFAVGCGGNSSDPGSGGPASSAGNAAPGGGFRTSVAGSTPLKDLTPEQLSQLCTDLQKYVDTALSAPLADYECKTFAVVAAAQASTDAAAETACKSSLAQCTPDTTAGTGMCTANEAATCTATVADATACINDESALVAALDASVPSCDGLTLAKVRAALATLAADGGNAATSPPSCTKYEAQCPGSMSGMP